MTPLRLGVVPYLNIEPFLASLRRIVACDFVRLHPSSLMSLWRASDLDACLLSVPDIFDGNLEPLRGAAISTDGAVRSVLLMGREPREGWTRIALDAASRTSNCLAKVLLRDLVEGEPLFHVCRHPAAALRSATVDAAVVIGDRALQAAPADVNLDLGALWKERTGLPFVFAAWVRGRETKLPAETLEAILDEARRGSRRHVEESARRHGRRLGISTKTLGDYLTRNISYRFERHEEAGMRCFRELLELRGVPPTPLSASAARGSR